MIAVALDNGLFAVLVAAFLAMVGTAIGWAFKERNRLSEGSVLLTEASKDHERRITHLEAIDERRIEALERKNGGT